MKKNYEPKGIENKIYDKWESSGYFTATPDEKKEPFSANDFSIGFSLKSEFEKLISIGMQFNLLNSKIENYDNKILKSGVGIKTRLLNKRLGIGIVCGDIVVINKAE